LSSVHLISVIYYSISNIVFLWLKPRFGKVIGKFFIKNALFVSCIKEVYFIENF
jgi:hypothetical protein